MTSLGTAKPRTPEPRTDHRAAAWALLTGGVFFFAGGPLHPHEDPPGVSVKEHLHVMFEDPLWYPAHALLLIGMIGIATALVLLARGRSLAGRPGMQAALVVAAVAAAIAAPASLLHLIAALDADRIAAHRSTRLTDVQVLVETVTTPVFGLATAALAAIGARTRTLGNWWAAAPGILGGLGYAVAGATFLFTDRTDPLFPTAAGIAVWAVVAGALLIRRSPR
ncbi:hypothetical protein ACWKSP_02335 [Micromonosporaceae bacterium Da 78-11]